MSNIIIQGEVKYKKFTKKKFILLTASFLSFSFAITAKVSQSPWIKYLEISSFILTIFPFILHGTVDNHVLALIFLIKICVDTRIKFLFIRLFDTSILMKRRICILFALDVIAYLVLGYLLVIQKAGYLFSVLLLFSNFSIPFIREKEYELFKNSK